MKNFQNNLEVNRNFKETLFRKIKEEDKQTLENGNFELGVSYFIQKLNNLEKDCVIGLTIPETFIIRQFFGFNEKNIGYNFDELYRIYNIKDSRESFIHGFYSISRVIRNILEVLNNELRDENLVNKILLGELNIPIKVFNTLHSNGIYTVGELIRHSRNDILKMKNIGKNAIQILEEALKSLDVNFTTNTTVVKKNNNFEYDTNTQPDLRKRRRDLKLKILGIEHKKILLQYEGIENEKRKIEKEIEKLLIEDAREVNITR